MEAILAEQSVKLSSVEKGKVMEAIFAELSVKLSSVKKGKVFSIK